MFLIVIQLIFVIEPPGRSLGVDAILWRDKSASSKEDLSSRLSLKARPDGRKL